ncbi:hypothetical protein A5662_20350 [Mycobacteriaceae bacterium 1482268.1]|nr:hypothetical protein A5662_20350 [Mycobacteriaceae bacterium 1482268.1]
MGSLDVLRWCVALTSILAVVFGALLWLKTSRAESSANVNTQQIGRPYGLAPMTKTQRTTALFVGDEFPAGYGGIDRNAYPYIVCASIGLNCNVDARPGTRFSDSAPETGEANTRLIDRLVTDRMIYVADVVIVDAGRNDLDEAPDAYGAGFEQCLSQVRRLWRDTKIVVIAPSYLSAEPDPAYRERISVISRLTEAFGASLVDPIAEQWYAATDVEAMTIPEGPYLNQAGHRFIARKLADSLLIQGIGAPGATI